MFHELNFICLVSKCIPCTKPSCCKKKWGVCVAPCAKWDGCCTKTNVKDPVCETYNAGCSVTRKTLIESLNVAEEGVKTTGDSLKVAKGTLSAAQATYKAGSDAASAIARLGLGGLIDIRMIEFDVEISVASGGRFSGRMEVSFLGKGHQRFSFDLRLKNIDAMAKDLAEMIFSGITK